MRIVFMGTPEFAVPCLVSLAEEAGFDVLAAVSQPDRPRGRGRKKELEPTPVKAAAIERGITVMQPERARDPEFISALKGLAPDVIAVVAYGKILPREILDIPPKGCVNVHASLLPKYRGASPINHAIMNGDEVTGVTTMLMDEGMDTGAMLLVAETPIEEDDTTASLSVRLSALGAELLVRTLKRLDTDGITPTPQDDSGATYAPMLRKTDGLIEWSRTAREIRDRMRGLYPWPGTYTTHEGRTLKVHSGVVSGAPCPDGSSSCTPGTVVEVSGDGIGVCTGSGVFVITEIQPENKKRMQAVDFVKGYRLNAGDRFE